MPPDATGAVHTAELVAAYDDPDVAALVAAAVSQELDEIDGDRATAGLRREDDTLYVDIDAEDLVALRAGLNTWGTLLEVAERMVDAGSS
jgi:KEOPS complex subunit Pcc1